jgi:transcriptional regulator with XRE-family HTH domain
MQQPELGKRLTALRKERNLTQEELVEKSHVSVRTIQRIEAGEVLPRMITIRILLKALGENYESFSTKQNQVMETQKSILPTNHRNTLLVATLAGAVYLVAEIILGTMDIAWFTDNRDWGFRMNAIYASLTIVMIVSFALFARGFIALSTVFENSLLKVAAYLFVVVTAGKGILDISSLSVENIESIWIFYAVIAVVMGAVGIVFGISLIRLQDGMGELARIAGILEIIIGCLLVTVVLFFITYVILIPTVVVEIIVLYRGYEYLSKPIETTSTV